MLAIIGHHYVVNSTVANHFDYNNTSAQQYFLEVWGLWGKASINSFILISGFFLCKMQFSWQRYLKLVVEVLFYSLLILFIFALTGHEQLTAKGVIKTIMRPLQGINNGFTASFLCFYAFVPIYNKVIDKCSQRELFYFICGLLAVISGCATFFRASTMNEPLWYMTIYFVAAYIRNYPNKYTNSLKLWSAVLVVSVIISVATCISAIYLSNTTGNMTFMHLRRYLVVNSNMPLAFLVGLSAFLTFKNIPPFYNRTINFLAAGTFAVLLIHAASDTMRHWLWIEVFNVPGMLHEPLGVLIAQALMIPIVIFVACSCFDYLRRRFFEKPLFRYINNRNKLKAESHNPGLQS